jgi:hypothetical protein
VNRTSNGRLGLTAVLLALVLLTTACGKKSTPPESGGSGGLTVKITSPTDGASVSEPFTLKVESSVPLGDPSTGEHHVHLCFDGQSCDSKYSLVYGNSFDVSGLAAGKHTIEASLRNADHSSAGATATITVTETGGATSSPTASPSGRYGGGGYGGSTYGGGGG